MTVTKLILVEGIPGTGKSTVAQWIHRQLCAADRSSYWWHEERDDHPLRLYFDPERHGAGEAYVDEAESLWRRFSQELGRQDQIAVLDAAFLQNHVRSMLIFDCDRSEILDLVRRIEVVISSFNPVLISLKASDLERNFSDVIAARGQRMMDLWIAAHDKYPWTQASASRGYSGFIAFWKEFSRISDSAFDELSILKHCQDVSGSDRVTRDCEIGKFLGLSSVSKLAVPQPLDRFVGQYVAQDSGGTPVVTLRVGDGCLLASVHEPTIDVSDGPFGCFREVRLIPKGKCSFYVVAWPHVVQFTESDTGEVLSMHLSVTEKGWPIPKHSFRGPI